VEAAGVVLVSEDRVAVAGQSEGLVDLEAVEGAGAFVGAGRGAVQGSDGA